MKKTDLISYLDDYLNIKNFEDKSKNGLQVDNEKVVVKKIGYSVDATNYIFDKAREEKVDFIIAHHGIFWGNEEVLVGLPYERIKNLVKSDIALYACHLPLDGHENIGNNIGLLKGFLKIFSIGDNNFSFPTDSKVLEGKNFLIEKFGKIGYGIKFKNKIHISSLQTLFCENLLLQNKLYNFGKKDFIDSIAFVSGGAGYLIKEANIKGYDLFLTGEAKHDQIFTAKELKQSILLAGHYETEKIGPKLLAQHLHKKFSIEIVFLDEKY